MQAIVDIPNIVRYCRSSESVDSLYDNISTGLGQVLSERRINSTVGAIMTISEFTRLINDNAHKHRQEADMSSIMQIARDQQNGELVTMLKSLQGTLSQVPPQQQNMDAAFSFANYIHVGPGNEASYHEMYNQA